MIHNLPYGYKDLYEYGKDVIKLSDVVILYDRKNKIEQAESLAFRKQKYKNDYSKYHINEPYDNISEDNVNMCLKYYNKQSEVITKLSKEFKVPIFWYEELYYEDGLEKLSNYLKVDIDKKYKEMFLSIEKKERVLKLKGDLI